MDWFSLSLLCALSLAAADALTKKYLPGYSGWSLLLVRFVVPGALLFPLLFIYPLPPVPYEFWLWLAFLVPLELLAMMLYMQAIRDAPLYQTLPYMAFTPVFNILTGWLVLGETVSLLGGAGIMLVVLGTYFLNIEHFLHNNRIRWFEPLKAVAIQQGPRRMLLAAIIYSITSVAGKAAMQYTEPLVFGPWYFVILGMATLLLVAVAKPAELKTLRRNYRHHIAIGCCMALMIVTHFMALSMIEAAYMIAVKRTSLLFGILFGAWLFNEPGLTRNLASASLMVAGVVVILLA